MRAVVLLIGIYFMVFISGCTTTKILTNYKDCYEYKYEKISPIESYKTVEIKKDNTFPVAREAIPKDGLAVYLLSIVIGIPVIDTFLCTPYQILFGKKLVSYNVEVLLKGQLLDNNNISIPNRGITVFVNDTKFSATTDDDGFFEETLEISGYDSTFKITNVITLSFDDIKYPSNEYTTPFVVQYTIDSTDNTIKREDTILSLSKKGIIQTTIEEKNPLSDIIYITTYEYPKK